MNIRNHCCTTFDGLLGRIKELIHEELKDVQPSYLASPTLKVVAEMGNFCTVCGESLKEEDDAVVVPPRKKQRKDEPSPSTPPPAPRTVTCNACGGTGGGGKDENGIESKCWFCQGKKVVMVRDSSLSPEKAEQLARMKKEITKKQEKTKHNENEA